MHEYSIAQSLLNQVNASLAGYRVLAVKRVHVRIGELSGVDGGLLRTAFELCRADTACREAELNLTVVPTRWSCPVCGREARPGEPLSCPVCGATLTLAAGDEILLERIEAEVDDV